MLTTTTTSGHQAVIKEMSRALPVPGQQITLMGTGFGHRQDTRRLLLTNAGVHWGGTGDLGTLTIERWDNTSITFTLPEPSGPLVSTSSGPTNLWRIEPGSTASITVIGLAGSTSNTKQFAVGDTDVLSDYFNDVGISSDNNPGCGSFSGNLAIYSATELATAARYALTSNTCVTVGGATFTCLSAPPCSNVNVRALSQTISLSHHVNYSAIGLLSAASSNSQRGAVTIHYTDGTSSTATLRLPKWSNPHHEKPYNVTVVAKMGYRNHAHGRMNHTVYVYEQSIPVNSDKTAKSLTLPNKTTIHIFSITENGSSAGPAGTE